MTIPDTVRRSEIKPLEVNGRTAASEVYLMDCAEGMKLYPDNYFELALTSFDMNAKKISINKDGGTGKAVPGVHITDQNVLNSDKNP